MDDPVSIARELLELASESGLDARKQDILKTAAAMLRAYNIMLTAEERHLPNGTPK